MNAHEFVAARLPPAPARVLEVGCGRGELTRSIAVAGYRIVGIDPGAPTGDLFQPVSLEEFAAVEAFDAVVARRSLHHVEDLPSALDRIVDLLRPAGPLILEEHAFERLDEATARWCLERRAAIEPGNPQTVDECLTEWSEDHAGLYGYGSMRQELDRRFDERFFTWMPYLHQELGEAASYEQERAHRGRRDRGDGIPLRR